MEFKAIENKIKNVNALTTPKERRTFCEYAKKVPRKGIIVDIGTAAGSSAFTFALASKPSVTVYTIDPSKNENFLSNRKEWKLEDRLVFVNKTSEEAAKSWKEKIDLLFIDGIHSYPGVKNDFDWFSRFVKPNGIIMFHDYYLHGNTIGAAVDGLEKNGLIEKIEIVDSLHKGEVRIGLFISKKPKGVVTDNYFEREYGDEEFVKKFCRTGLNGIGEVWRQSFKDYVEDGQSFLDVGCGTGADWELLQVSKRNITYKGIDYAPSILEGAKKLCPGAVFAVGDVNDISEEDNSWDVVNCRHVINHCEYYERPIKELVRVAKKRVILTLHVPFSSEEVDEIREFPPYSWESSFARGKFLKFLKTLKVKIVVFEEFHKGGKETFIVLDKHL